MDNRELYKAQHLENAHDSRPNYYSNLEQANMTLATPYPPTFENTPYFLDNMADFDPTAPLAGTY